MEKFIFVLVIVVWYSSAVYHVRRERKRASSYTADTHNAPRTNKEEGPHKLKKNELPQGVYLVGREIPPGTYDFYVVYGHGGSLDIAKYDAAGKIIDGTWKTYWVGLKESYEAQKVIHVLCAEGYTVKIRGNVVLKIVKSQDVCIDL